MFIQFIAKDVTIVVRSLITNFKDDKTNWMGMESSGVKVILQLMVATIGSTRILTLEINNTEYFSVFCHWKQFDIGNRENGFKLLSNGLIGGKIIE